MRLPAALFVGGFVLGALAMFALGVHCIKLQIRTWMW